MLQSDLKMTGSARNAPIGNPTGAQESQCPEKCQTVPGWAGASASLHAPGGSVLPLLPAGGKRNPVSGGSRPRFSLFSVSGNVSFNEIVHAGGSAGAVWQVGEEGGAGRAPRSWRSPVNSPQLPLKRHPPADWHLPLCQNPLCVALLVDTSTSNMKNLQGSRKAVKQSRPQNT